MNETPQRSAVNTAIAKAMLSIQPIVKGEKNPHGGYSFASIDGFLGLCQPICGEHELYPVINTTAYEQFDGANNKLWATYTYQICMAHSSGEETKPVTTIVSLPITGAQTSGSAQSYALKQYLRGLFLIATGERDDPDFQPPSEITIKNRQPTKPTPQKSNGKNWDLAALKEEVKKHKTQVSLNAFIQEKNPEIMKMHSTAPADYNRFYAVWKQQEEDIKDRKA